MSAAEGSCRCGTLCSALGVSLCARDPCAYGQTPEGIEANIRRRETQLPASSFISSFYILRPGKLKAEKRDRVVLSGLPFSLR
ncbi:hypothetical protein NDU88_007863 [Pleurodeles waltl]|uniref:Secreted protein n=1 Tax=Pleurodeles waltl TaxID=8319 RepID=A0AAV7QP72_PLEWA|nr:hypothetical protein NDU88_007863 [Pleurodeles waltl]